MNDSVFSAVAIAVLFASTAVAAPGIESDRLTLEITAPRPAPFPNYWDAKAWDPEGSTLFWHKRIDDRPRAKSAKPARPAEKPDHHPTAKSSLPGK